MSETACCCSVRESVGLPSSENDSGPDVVSSSSIRQLLARLPAVQALVSLTCLILHFVPSVTNRLPFDPAWGAILLCGIPILLEALHGLGKRRIGAPLLISIAMIATIGIGEPFAAGEIAFIMFLGEFLESWTIRRARAGIERLVRLTPKTARRLCPETGAETTVSLDAIRSGDCLRVLPGETIPVDGLILEGNTSIDQQLISGEALPVDKEPGDEVFSGTINRFGVFTMEATKVGEDSSLARMIRLVREAEQKQAPMERIADRWAAWLVPAAILTALVVALATGEITRGVTILVVFCPCSLVLATPTAVIAAIGNATKYGILIRGGEALERLGRIDTVVFDKTGTLTLGQPSLHQVHPLSDAAAETAGITESEDARRELLRIAVSVERMSEHPLSRAVVEAAGERGIDTLPSFENRIIPGRGIEGTVEGRRVLIGNESFLRENGLAPGEAALAETERFLQQGRTIVWVAADGRPLGFLTVSDTVRPDAEETVRQCRAEGAEVLLLTGDNRQAARHVAASLGIDDFRAEQRPEDKLATIAELQRRGRRVAMVGDGLNDAPALKSADVGIAVGTSGNDLAMEAADVTLIGADMSRVPFLVRLSRKTRRTIIGNIIFSMGFNAVAVVLASGGFIDPVAGALIHNVASVAVILNASLLLGVRKTGPASATAGRGS